MNSDIPGGGEANSGTHRQLVKSLLAEAVAQSIEVSQKEAAGIVELIFDSISRSLHRGEKVELRGFGVFGIRKRRGRIGRNPKTGEPVVVAPKRVAVFAMSRTLQRELNRTAIL